MYYKINNNSPEGDNKFKQFMATALAFASKTLAKATATYNSTIKPHISQLLAKGKKAFLEHPNKTGESYPQHLLFTVKISLKLMLYAIIVVIHGLLPFLFTTTTSTNLEKISATMNNRLKKAGLKNQD